MHVGPPHVRPLRRMPEVNTRSYYPPSFSHRAAKGLGSYSFSGRLAGFEIRAVSNEDADITPDAIVHGLGDDVAVFFPSGEIERVRLGFHKLAPFFAQLLIHFF